MAKRLVSPTRAATDALVVLGTQLRAARHDKNWTAAELGARIGADPRTITASIDLVFVAKAIERVGDHAKNLAEQIIYIVKGADIRHTPLDDVESAIK